jgi:hypothetical protein
MGQGGWRVAVCLDERAGEEQREALGAVLSGARSGPPEMLAGLAGKQLGVKFVPISFTSDGYRKRVEVPGIMEFEVEGLRASDSSVVMEIVNVFHPVAATFPSRPDAFGTAALRSHPSALRELPRPAAERPGRHLPRRLLCRLLPEPDAGAGGGGRDECGLDGGSDDDGLRREDLAIRLGVRLCRRNPDDHRRSAASWLPPVQTTLLG